jgi:glycosyltransferase involved in cell wall biosynthesis
MAKYLIGKGHKVTMVFVESPRLKSPLKDKPYTKGRRRGNYEGIDLIEFNLRYSNKMNMVKRSLIFLRYSFRSIGLVFREKFDVVLATSTPLTAGIPGIVMKLSGKKKTFVFEVRDLWPELPRAMGVIKNRFFLRVMEYLESLSYNKADACIALSPGIETGIKDRLKKDKPVYMIPNGCDLQLFNPGSYAKTIYPGCDEKDFISVFIGAHGIANGLDSALDAAAELKKTKSAGNIKIALIGDGMLKDHLIKRAEEEELDNVIFISPVPKKEIVNYLHAADLGLMLLADIPAFYYGTSPNKFFDYISSGLPVLNNYPGWLAEMIKDNNLGIVTSPGDAREFANALVKLSGDRDRLKDMRREARNFAEVNFDWQILAAGFEQAILDNFRED